VSGIWGSGEMLLTEQSEVLEEVRIPVPHHSPSIPYRVARDLTQFSAMRNGPLNSSDLPRTFWSLAFLAVMYKTSVPTQNAIRLSQCVYILLVLISHLPYVRTYVSRQSKLFSRNSPKLITQH
jgi:hypothetical protein